MKRTWIFCLAWIMLASILLVSCEGGSAARSPIPSATTDAESAGTETSVQTTPTTVKSPSNNETPKNLVPKMEEQNAILSRLVQNPVVTEIGNSGVSIELSYYAWPTVCKGDGSTVYVAASLRRDHVDPFSATAFFVSHDNGETWSEPRIINNTPVDDRDTGIVYLGNGRMLVSFFTLGASEFLPGASYATQWGDANHRQVAAKRLEWDTYTEQELAAFEGSFVILSEDYGQTWSEPIKIGISGPHGPTLLNDGSTLLYAGLGVSNGARVFMTYVSRDCGRTWTQESKVELPTLPDKSWGYWEPYVLQLSDGSYVGGIRTGTTGGTDPDGNRYVGEATLGVLVTTSRDGKSWTTPQKIETVNGAPPHFLELENGVLLLTYSYRLREQDGGNGAIGSRGRISYDGGKTWSKKEIIISESIGTANYDLGYPSTVQLEDGSLLTVYYQPYGEDAACSVLYTKWRLVEAEEE